MKRYYIYITSLFLLLSCQSTSNPSPESEASTNEVSDDLVHITKEQFTSSGYNMDTIQNIYIQKEINAVGEVHIPKKSYQEISHYMGGIVSGMDFIKGQYVSQGSRLFQLSNPELINWQKEYLETRSRLAYLREETERQRRLAEENISAKKNYSSIKSEMEIAEAGFASVTAQLKMVGLDAATVSSDNIISRMSVFAPVSGYVTDIEITNGTKLEAGESAISIMNTAHKHIELKVLEKDIAYIEKGQKVYCTLGSNPDKEYKAEIYMIERLLDDNRMSTVHCHVENESDKALVPGMYVQARITIDEHQVKALPTDAIVNLSSASYVLKKSGMHGYNFQKVKITPGLTQRGMTEITDAQQFNKNDVFLTKGAYYMLQEE